jgi:hypothetical protein
MGRINKILKKINEMLRDRDGLSNGEINFLSGVRRYYRHSGKLSDKQIAVFNEISNRYVNEN